MMTLRERKAKVCLHDFELWLSIGGKFGRVGTAVCMFQVMAVALHVDVQSKSVRECRSWLLVKHCWWLPSRSSLRLHFQPGTRRKCSCFGISYQTFSLHIVHPFSLVTVKKLIFGVFESAATTWAAKQVAVGFWTGTI